MTRLAKLIATAAACAFAVPALAAEPPVTDAPADTTESYTTEDGQTVTPEGALITVDPAEDVAGEFEGYTTEPGLDALEGETEGTPDMTEDMWGKNDTDTEIATDSDDEVDAETEVEDPLD